MPQKDRNDLAAQPAGAPELDPELLDAQRQSEIDAAFSVENDADVVVELSDDTVVSEPASKVQAVESAAAQAAAPGEVKDDTFVKRCARAYWAHKLWTIPLSILLLAGLLMAIPSARYALLSTFVKNEVQLLILDQTTHRPVISAKVSADGAAAMTDTEGRVSLKLPVGERQVTVSKRYYRDSQVKLLVPVLNDPAEQDVKIQATGRQVPLAVVNKLSGKPVADVLLKAAGSEIKTDKDGKAIIVMPADKPQQAIEMSAEAYNNQKATLLVTEVADPKNTFQITPAGKVYFLSKQSGRIDVVKTDLDGANRQTIVAGTGREEDRNTILLASRDWKHLALLSRRDADQPKLYLIETASDSMKVIDQDDASFQLIGWSDNNFVYYANRNTAKDWETGKGVLKSYDVGSGKLVTLDQTLGEGAASAWKRQNFYNFYLTKKRVVYTADWQVAYNFIDQQSALADKQLYIRSMAVDGKGKKDLKTLPASKYSFFQAKLYAPDEIYYAVYGMDEQKQIRFEYSDGVVIDASLSQEDFDERQYPTFLSSPSGSKTFWSEQRDGKETFLLGDSSAQNEDRVATLADHQVYGWYGDNYLLISKKGSELYITPTDGSKVTKVTDYHRPNTSFPGYGGGYGGL